MWGIRLGLHKPKYTSLEIANQMYKDAWLVKRTQFQKKFPHLSSAELDKKTSEYFAQLKDQ
ncbi:hypothetical protein AZI86_15000 [Bdellovibrio bacteriovorus]|uniref:Uncharacterized protein n=1 Tax=Bdellovibrio bacteriovorus TaxID=959 RepID=A0A150WK65_BDEBC|nr:hypothetical protein AZI86_15000 [Bdellovibrio bacteriovorus]